MTIKEIIQKLRTTMDDARGQDSHFESWLTQNEGICDAIDMLKALAKQEQGEPVAYSATSDERLMKMPKQEQGESVTKPTKYMVLALRGNSGLSTQDAYDALVDVLAVMPLYTTPQQLKEKNK